MHHKDGDKQLFDSRAATPDFWEDGIVRPNHAPFRRAFTEDDKDGGLLSEQYNHDGGISQGTKTPIDFPVTVPISMDGSTSTVAFPVSSPDQAYTFEGTGGMRSRYNSFPELHGPAFIRSRVHSRLADHVDAGEPGWRTRRESTA